MNLRKGFRNRVLKTVFLLDPAAALAAAGNGRGQLLVRPRPQEVVAAQEATPRHESCASTRHPPLSALHHTTLHSTSLTLCCVHDPRTPPCPRHLSTPFPTPRTTPVHTHASLPGGSGSRGELSVQPETMETCRSLARGQRRSGAANNTTPAPPLLLRTCIFLPATSWPRGPRTNQPPSTPPPAPHPPLTPPPPSQRIEADAFGQFSGASSLHQTGPREGPLKNADVHFSGDFLTAKGGGTKKHHHH